MTLGRVIATEFHKALRLPAIWVGVAVGMAGILAIGAINALQTRQALLSGDAEWSTSFIEATFAALPLGTVGAVIVGVLVMGSEYSEDSSGVGSGRQITSTLTATPVRSQILMAKAVTVMAFVVVMAALIIPASIFLVRLIIGEVGVETVGAGGLIARSMGATLYWLLTGLMALSLAALARGVLIPLTFLIVNNSLVSFSYLLTKVTPLANWLPDLAGRNLFMTPGEYPEGLDAVPGALVMGAWTVALLLIAGRVFSRRDG